MLNNINQVDPHDYSGNLFIGRVVDNQDPLRLRRIKVNVPKLFIEAPERLPWVGPKTSGPIANGSGFGSFNKVPSVGSMVFVELQDGSTLHGLYTASPIRLGTTPNEFLNNYLGQFGWKDEEGNFWYFDSTPGTGTKMQVKFASSGLTLSITNDGNIVIDNGNVIINQGNVTVNQGSVLVNQGNIAVEDGNITCHNGVATINGGSINCIGGDVTADGISLKHHTHGNVTNGDGHTGQSE